VKELLEIDPPRHSAKQGKGQVAAE
jgi:hypothetical protein